MIWTINYTAQAKRDLDNIYDYISGELFMPIAAANQVDKIMKAIRRLEEMPMRHQIYEEEPWYSQGLRFLPVGNYLVFYLLDEMNAVVSVIRVMYSGRDIKRQLSVSYGEFSEAGNKLCETSEKE